jgi:predicted negative regulator of RcsB-dependent stress response
MKTTLHVPTEQLKHFVHIARKNAAIIFLVFLVVIYGALSWRIMQLLQAEPDQSAVTAELKTIGVPKVDEDVVKKMEKLEDNSVSVHTLFEDARSNPFQE